MRRRFHLLLVLLCTACTAGDGTGLDMNGRPLEEGGESPGDTVFDRIQATILTPICTVCHAGANAPLGLRLDADNSYLMLVGVPSVEVPSLLRVDPGNPDDSYLVQKIEGTAAVGAQMPLGGPSLPVDSMQLVRQWIRDGAEPPADFIVERIDIESGTGELVLASRASRRNVLAIASEPRP